MRDRDVQLSRLSHHLRNMLKPAALACIFMSMCSSLTPYPVSRTLYPSAALRATWQIPSRAHVYKVRGWPTPIHRHKTIAEYVDDTCKELKLPHIARGSVHGDNLGFTKPAPYKLIRNGTPDGSAAAGSKGDDTADGEGQEDSSSAPESDSKVDEPMLDRDGRESGEAFVNYETFRQLLYSEGVCWMGECFDATFNRAEKMRRQRLEKAAKA